MSSYYSTSYIYFLIKIIKNIVQRSDSDKNLLHLANNNQQNFYKNKKKSLLNHKPNH